MFYIQNNDEPSADPIIVVEESTLQDDYTDDTAGHVVFSQVQLSLQCS